MANRIVVAGATGNLGKRIVRELMKRDAAVIALMRTGAPAEKIEELMVLGATVKVVTFPTPARLQGLLRVQIAWFLR